MLFVEIHFLARDFGGEKIQAEDAIPDQIVFLTPRAAAIKREPEMIAVIGFLYPALRESARELEILLGLRLVAA